MSASIRIASWNIHGAIGRDRRCDPDRIATILRSMDADVVALQEIDGRTRLGRRPEAFETFAALLGGSIVEARLIGQPGREHGHLLWSRLPIRESGVHLLPGGLEQRGLIAATIETPFGPLAVLAAHLSLSPFARRRQARFAVTVAASFPMPTILVGDLNEWARRGPVHRILSHSLPAILAPATFPSRRPIAALDRAYADPGLALTLRPSPDAANEASDHRPLLFEARPRT